MNDEYLKEIIVKYRIDYIVHGDDPCIVDGKDVYEAAQRLGKYLTIPRTEEISTTAVVWKDSNIHTYIYLCLYL
jgi:ethanolamine-phosphate cytidylyltransferase